jgi:hypothetical protein
MIPTCPTCRSNRSSPADRAHFNLSHLGDGLDNTLCRARSASLQYPDFFFGLRLPAFAKAIAAACRFGLPSRRNFAIFAETVFDDLPGFNGMSSFQLIKCFAGAVDQVFAARQERVDDVPDSDV